MKEQDKQTAVPEDLTKTTEPESIQLTEEQLDKVTGGALNAYLKID